MVGWSWKPRLRVGALPQALFLLLEKATCIVRSAILGQKHVFVVLWCPLIVPWLSLNVPELSLNVLYCPLIVYYLSVNCPLMSLLWMTVCLRDLLCQIGKSQTNINQLIWAGPEITQNNNNEWIGAGIVNCNRYIQWNIHLHFCFVPLMPFRNSQG